MAMTAAPLLPPLARPRWCIAVALPLLLWRWCLQGSGVAARSSKVVAGGLEAAAMKMMERLLWLPALHVW